MSGNASLIALAAVLTALVVGMACGASMQASADRRAAAAARRRKNAAPETGSVPAPAEKPRPKWMSASKWIALGILLVDASSTYFVLYLCWLSITRQFTGSLPYLTALIGAMQAATGYVLGHYFKKSTAENTVGGITYDAALGTVSNSDTSSAFDFDTV